MTYSTSALIAVRIFDLKRNPMAAVVAGEGMLVA